MLFLFQIINQLVVDVLVGVILASIKAIAQIEDFGLSEKRNTSKNVFLEHNYNHWERTILWLEDILEANFSYLDSQIHFLTTLIGLFYGSIVGILLILLNIFANLGASLGGILIISVVFGVALGIAGGKSITNRPDIFDKSSDEFKGEHFDR